MGWGGARAGAGRKKKGIDQKLLEGKALKADLKTSVIQQAPKPEELAVPQPDPGKFSTSASYIDVSNRVNAWMKDQGCTGAVPLQLIMDYVRTESRLEDIENQMNGEPYCLTDSYGKNYLNPMVKAADTYRDKAMKQWNQIMLQIQQWKSENSARQMDEMEGLLS